MFKYIHSTNKKKEQKRESANKKKKTQFLTNTTLFSRDTKKYNDLQYYNDKKCMLREDGYLVIRSNSFSSTAANGSDKSDPLKGDQFLCGDRYREERKVREQIDYSEDSEYEETLVFIDLCSTSE